MNTLGSLIALAKLHVSLQLYMMFVTGSSQALRHVQKYSAAMSGRDDERMVRVVRTKLKGLDSTTISPGN